LSNSDYAAQFAAIWKTEISLNIGNFELKETLAHWINDALMTIFFFVVGLEIKRELVAGELRDPRKAALPVMAALGGMIFPGLIYLVLRVGRHGQEGWGIPMATDIAFVVGFLALLGSRVPAGLKIMLLSLAIADDLGAILIIALVYSKTISLQALAWAAGGFLLVFIFNWLGVRRVMIYVIIGIGIWFAFYFSGIHPTVAGVLLGLATPASAWLGNQSLLGALSSALDKLHNDAPADSHLELDQVQQLALSARETVSPLERLEVGLHPWVAFVIMPLFALANAGVTVHDPAVLLHPVSLAVAAGLIVGKPLGIVLFSRWAVRLGLAALPTGVNWNIMLGAGCLAGIGFTMSLFIANLALQGDLLDAGKLGTLLGSTVSAVLGCVLLLVFLPKKTGKARMHSHHENQEISAMHPTGASGAQS
jgi:NhaA family Na+:H+ antiporter